MLNKHIYLMGAVKEQKQSLFHYNVIQFTVMLQALLEWDDKDK